MRKRLIILTIALAFSISMNFALPGITGLVDDAKKHWKGYNFIENKYIEAIKTTTAIKDENDTVSGNWTFSGNNTISGKFERSGALLFFNSFEMDGSNWDASAKGAKLPASQSAGSKCWLPITGLKKNDVITKYRIIGDKDNTNTTKIDAKLVKLTKGDPLSTSNVTDGAITTQTGDGVFDVTQDCSQATVAASSQYYIELSGETGTSDAIYVQGVEVTIDKDY